MNPKVVNKPMNPKVLKMAVGLIGTENIKFALISIIQAAVNQKKLVELTDSESDAVLILYENSGISYAGIFTIDDTATPPIIVRSVNAWPLDDLVENLIKNM